MFDLNQEVTVNELTRLNDQLRKNADLSKASFNSSFGAAGSVGYQDAAVTAGAGALAPLVPQSIEQVLASATFTMNDLKLWQMLPKVQVTNTLHEYAVINEHGLDLDPFISEGGGASSDFGTSQSSYERKSVKIKYMAERRQVSDVAGLVGIIGANPNAIAEETERGTMSLLRKVESQLFHGNEDVNGKGFDGIIKQIARTSGALREDGSRPYSDNVKDHGGINALLPTDLHNILGELYSSPRFGRPDFIMMEPRVYANLIKQSVQDGRHDSMMLVNYGDRGVQTFGAGPNLHVMGPQGPVPIVSPTFLSNQFAAPSAASSSATGLPSFSGTAGALGGAGVTFSIVRKAETVVGSSEFKAADAGAYIYKVVLVNSIGYSAPIQFPAINIVADDVVEFKIVANEFQNLADGSFRIYRSDKNGAASTCKLVQEISFANAVALKGALALGWQDWGHNINGTSSVIFGQMTQDNIEFAKLLDFIRRPLAETSSAKQFLLMLFGSPVVKTPKKNYVLRNVKADLA